MARIQHISKGYAALHKLGTAQADLVKRGERIVDAVGDPRIVLEPSSPIRKRNRVAIIALGGDPDNKIIRNLDAGA